MIEILNKVDPTHRVKFTGWEIDFYDTDWPTLMEFAIGTTEVDSLTNTLRVYLKEVDDGSFGLDFLKTWYNQQCELYDDIKFFFNGTEVEPSFGDVGHSDKVTHIDFEPIKVTRYV